MKSSVPLEFSVFLLKQESKQPRSQQAVVVRGGNTTVAGACAAGWFTLDARFTLLATAGEYSTHRFRVQTMRLQCRANEQLRRRGDETS